jgi:hypothetical protein
MAKPNLTDPSDDVLGRLPARAFTFISTLSTSRPIFALVAARGLDKDILADGWKKLHAVSGYAVDGAAPSVDVSPETRAALVEVDAWDEPNFAVTRAALAVGYPSACEFLMNGLEAAQGRGAIQSVGTYLRRLDALESGKGRDKHEHKTDKAAIAKLASRGITSEVRARLEKLVASLEEGPDDAEPAASPAVPLSGPRRAALVALYGWFFEWSETARAVIRRRDYLIRLGLAQRKPKKTAPGGGTGTSGGGASGSAAASGSGVGTGGAGAAGAI